MKDKEKVIEIDTQIKEKIGFASLTQHTGLALIWTTRTGRELFFAERLGGCATNNTLILYIMVKN